MNHFLARRQLHNQKKEDFAAVKLSSGQDEERIPEQIDFEGGVHREGS